MLKRSVPVEFWASGSTHQSNTEAWLYLHPADPVRDHECARSHGGTQLVDKVSCLTLKVCYFGPPALILHQLRHLKAPQTMHFLSWNLTQSLWTGPRVWWVTENSAYLHFAAAGPKCFLTGPVSSKMCRKHIIFKHILNIYKNWLLYWVIKQVLVNFN